MNNRELQKIIEQIQIKEGIDLTEIATKAGVNRSYLSSTINKKANIEVMAPFIGKLSKAFPAYFGDQQKTTEDRLLSSLKEIRELAIAILTGQSAGQEVIMGALDRLEEKPEGSLSAAADKLALQLAQRMNAIQMGSDGEGRKKSK